MSPLTAPHRARGNYEPERILAALDDHVFDRITALAARRFGTPISLITVADEGRFWIKSYPDHGVAQIEPGPACPYPSAILPPEPYIIEDSAIDPRMRDAPFLIGAIPARFYAAVPLKTKAGHILGTLCVADGKPHQVQQALIDDLVDLAAIAMDHIDVVLAAGNAQANANLMVREVDHRVMNSLQVVSALLSLQVGPLDEGTVKEQLRLAANRISAIAQVHRLFFADDAGSASVLTYLSRLCAELQTVVGRTIVVRGVDGCLPAGSIQSLGLLANELVMKAAKREPGLIEVVYCAHEDGHSLEVSYEGASLPDAFDPNVPGARLSGHVTALMLKQLNGKLVISTSQNGRSSVTVQFCGPKMSKGGI